MAAKNTTRQINAQKKSIKNQLKKVSAATLIGCVIHNVLQSKSEQDFHTLLKGFAEQAKTDPSSVYRILGKDLFKAIKSYLADTAHSFV